MMTTTTQANLERLPFAGPDAWEVYKDACEEMGLIAYAREVIRRADLRVAKHAHDLYVRFVFPGNEGAESDSGTMPSAVHRA